MLNYNMNNYLPRIYLKLCQKYKPYKYTSIIDIKITINL